MDRNCYTEADVKKFREAIIAYVVPVADRLFREQAQRLGRPYPLSYADTAPMFLSGNPVPKGTADDILAAGKKFYHELSPESSAFIDVMFKNELMDVLSRKGKEGGGYCAGIPDYKVPFIFANFNGTQGDVEVLTHEGGHAFAGYTARDVFPLELQSPTLESCEIHSMSMEFFAWPWAEDFFGDQADKYRYAHLAGALKFLPYGTMVDHFQHIVYEQPDLTPDQRHEKWAELTKIYMPWIRLGDMPFWGEGKAWQRQSHIYESPFYYIDYCLAQSVALQFWALMQEDRAGAWKRYYDLVKLAGTRTYRELVTSAGLNDPFEPEGLKAACEAAGKWLDGCDMTKIK
jgi:M3 family oligoendopeptidase